MSAAAGVGLMLPGTLQANSIQQSSGKVFVNQRFAGVGTPVSPDDVITVSHGGSASLTINQDAYLLRGGTTMQLESDENALVTSLRLLTGAVMGVFAKGKKTIHTRTATIGVRGTGLYLDTAPEKTYFCTCYGETELMVPGVKNQTFTATHHNAVMIHTPPSGENRIEKMTALMYHTDDELRAMESLQGRKVPFDT